MKDRRKTAENVIIIFVLVIAFLWMIGADLWFAPKAHADERDILRTVCEHEGYTYVAEWDVTDPMAITSLGAQAASEWPADAIPACGAEVSQVMWEVHNG